MTGRTRWRLHVALLVTCTFAFAEPVSGDAGPGSDTRQPAAAVATAGEHSAAVHETPYPVALYSGTDERGVPRYLGNVFTPEERRLLRLHFGVEHAERLYISGASGHLTYDTEFDRGARHYVNSYRIGGISARQADESWEDFERRVQRMPRFEVGAEALYVHTSLDALHAEVREQFRRMLADAREAGLDVRVVETYRSPARQAYLLGKKNGTTYTGTSTHSDGRAADLVIGDGDLRNPATRARWAEFRRWVLADDGGAFTIIGTPESSWDWPHVAIQGEQPGYTSLEAALDAARQEEKRRMALRRE